MIGRTEWKGRMEMKVIEEGKKGNRIVQKKILQNMRERERKIELIKTKEKGKKEREKKRGSLDLE